VDQLTRVLALIAAARLGWLQQKFTTSSPWIVASWLGC
jgi:hypothetical protein